jgi:hypothetical protein
LDETYNRILGAIKESDIPYALRILRWLAFSSRPMLLAEVAEIAAIDANRCPAFDRDEVLEDPLEVLSICSSLVTVIASDKLDHYGGSNVSDGESDVSGGESDVSDGSILLLAHYSVKEYLVSQRILESKVRIYAMESALCRRSIAKCCLQYLLQFDRPDALTEGNLNEFALAKYSAQQWITHLELNGAQDAESVTLIIKLLNPEGAANLTWIRLYDPDHIWEGTNFTRTLPMIVPPLYRASDFGLADVVRRLISESDTDINAQGGYYGNALQAASVRGHEQVVKLLLDKGAEINAQGGYYGNALQAASVEGHEQVVKLLLDKGAEINAQGGYYCNALQAASAGGREQVAKLLLDKGAEINAQGGHYDTHSRRLQPEATSG